MSGRNARPSELVAVHSSSEGTLVVVANSEAECDVYWFSLPAWIPEFLCRAPHRASTVHAIYGTRDFFTMLCVPPKSAPYFVGSYFGTMTTWKIPTQDLVLGMVCDPAPRLLLDSDPVRRVGDFFIYSHRDPRVEYRHRTRHLNPDPKGRFIACHGAIGTTALLLLAYERRIELFDSELSLLWAEEWPHGDVAHVDFQGPCVTTTDGFFVQLVHRRNRDYALLHVFLEDETWRYRLVPDMHGRLLEISEHGFVRVDGCIGLLESPSPSSGNTDPLDIDSPCADVTERTKTPEMCFTSEEEGSTPDMRSVSLEEI